jgi:Bacterial toxin 46
MGTTQGIITAGEQAPFVFAPQILASYLYADLAVQSYEGARVASQSYEATIIGRINTAGDFYTASGFDPQEAAQHMAGINFDENVSVTTLEKGSVVNQWVDNTTGQVGNYFTTGANGDANLGLNISDRTLHQYTLTQDVKVLQSTAADFNGNPGGGT